MYIVHEDVILKNIFGVRNAFAKHGLDLMLCYSYKTNAMPCVLDIMNRNGVVPEVVSEHEYDMAKRFNAHVVCNGVSMSYASLAFHVKNEDIVNFNDAVSIEKTREELCNDVRYNVGVRVRFDNASRFGIHVHDIPHVLDVIDENKFDLDVLHCHVTGTRELSKYRKKVKSLVNVVVDNCIKPRILDFGGSMYGAMSKKLSSQFEDVGSFDDYACIIAEEIAVLDYKPVIALELGTALIANAVSVIGEIIRIDEYNRIVLDVDKFSVGMVSSKEMSYTYIPLGDKKFSIGVYEVYGCTCIEDDRLIKEIECAPAIGDRIEFHDCGAYSYCFEPDFIVPRQEVLLA